MRGKITQWFKGYIEKDGEVIYSAFDTEGEIWTRICRSLKMRVRHGSLKPEDKVLIHVQDASGYFKECPEILGGYFHEEGKVSEFIKI